MYKNKNKNINIHDWCQTNHTKYKQSYAYEIFNSISIKIFWKYSWRKCNI